MLDKVGHWVCVWGSKVRVAGAFHNQAGEELLVRGPQPELKANGAGGGSGKNRALVSTSQCVCSAGHSQTLKLAISWGLSDTCALSLSLSQVRPSWWLEAGEWCRVRKTLFFVMHAWNLNSRAATTLSIGQGLLQCCNNVQVGLSGCATENKLWECSVFLHP